MRKLIEFLIIFLLFSFIGYMKRECDEVDMTNSRLYYTYKITKAEFAQGR